MRALQIAAITGLILGLATATNLAAEVSPEKAIQIRVEIKQLVDDYAITRDTLDAEKHANLFSEDATLILLNGSYTGKKALKERVESTDPAGVSMHVMSSSQINIIDEENATGIHYTTVYATSKDDSYKEGDMLDIANFLIMGKYHDRYVLTDDGWKFSERRLEPIFKGTVN